MQLSEMEYNLTLKLQLVKDMAFFFHFLPPPQHLMPFTCWIYYITISQTYVGENQQTFLCKNLNVSFDFITVSITFLCY